MQRVEIIRALLTNPKLLILDEPTSVLTPQAVEKLFVMLAPARGRGLLASSTSATSCDEIRALCTAARCCAPARSRARSTRASETNACLSRLMIGAEPPQLEHHEREPGDGRC